MKPGGQYGVGGVIAGVLACGRATPVSPQSASVTRPVAANHESSAPVGDAGLERARRSLREGQIPAPIREELMNSSAPAHARAQRIFAAMQPEPPPPTAAVAGAGSATTPPLIVPTEAEPAAKSRAPSVPVRARTNPRSTVVGGRVQVKRLRLRSHPRGATLTIAAPSSPPVGIVHEPSRRIVRLVVESADAHRAVLNGRPTIAGVEVIGVRQGEGTVQISVRLAPGWSLGSNRAVAGGVRVRFVAPT